MRHPVTIHLTSGGTIKFRCETFEVKYSDGKPTGWTARGMSPRGLTRLVYLDPKAIAAVTAR